MAYYLVPDPPAPATIRSSSLGMGDLKGLKAQLAQAFRLIKGLPRSPKAPSLVFLRPGQTTPEAVPIGQGLTVGRDDACTVSFRGRSELSRRHFAVNAEGNFFVAEDLGSSSGTTIEGRNERLYRRELREGDILHAGGIAFLFVRG